VWEQARKNDDGCGGGGPCEEEERELVAVFGNGFFFLHPALTLLIG
jgi:hypothetical protein